MEWLHLRFKNSQFQAMATSFSDDTLAPTFGAEALLGSAVGSAGAARAPASSVGEQSSAAAAAPPPPPRAARKQREIAQDLPAMMFGFGDSSDPLPESVELMETLVKDYIAKMTARVEEVRVEYSVNVPPPAMALLFLLRNFASTYRQRCDDLLVSKKEIEEKKKPEKEDIVARHGKEARQAEEAERKPGRGKRKRGGGGRRRAKGASKKPRSSGGGKKRAGKKSS